MPQKTAPQVIATLEQLRQEHARLEMRLKELERHLSLSPEEQLERANLKKAKLQLKDDILHLTHQQRLMS
jgi:uncharacterized protein YdcH (DUF465 family)